MPTRSRPATSMGSPWCSRAFAIFAIDLFRERHNMGSMSRRQVLQRSAVLLATASLGAAEADASVPIVDTHQHLWDLERFRLLWMKDVKPLQRSFLLSDYVEATQG